MQNGMQHRLLTVVAITLGVVCFFFVLQMVFIPFVQQQDSDADRNTTAAMPTDHFELGEYYFNATNEASGTYDLKQARYHYEQAIAEDPAKYELVWYQLGRIDFLEGSFDAALYKFQKQLEYFPDGPPRVYYMIGLTHGYKARATKRAEDWEQAAQGFLRYLERDPGSPWARTDLAWVYFAQGKFAAMQPVLELGLSLSPEHPWLLNMYGLYLANTDRPQEAIAYFDRALAAANVLTVDDWGRAYPGNNPLFWEDGLKEFQEVVAYNRALVTSE